MRCSACERCPVNIHLVSTTNPLRHLRWNYHPIPTVKSVRNIIFTINHHPISKKTNIKSTNALHDINLWSYYPHKMLPTRQQVMQVMQVRSQAHGAWASSTSEPRCHWRCRGWNGPTSTRGTQHTAPGPRQCQGEVKAKWRKFVDKL